MIFYFKRHIVAVEYNSKIVNSKIWQKAFTRITLKAAEQLGFSSRLELSPIPEKHKVLSIFKSFSRLTRMTVNLLIPNPELTNTTKILYEDLIQGGIREYLQDMKNPNGLSQSPDSRPYISAALAEAGYKKGEVKFEGILDGEFKIKRTAEEATRGKINQLKDFVRGILVSAKTQEAQRVLTAIVQEINNIHPIDHEE